MEMGIQGMKAFDDLRSEWRQVGTNKFHMIERVGDREIFEEGLSLGLPRSYITFLREVGAVKLYRQGDGYDVGVYPVASTATLDNGEPPYALGTRGQKKPVSPRHKGGRFDGGLWLNVKDMAPGQEAVVERDCYSELAPISEHEFYDLPDPDPEPRTLLGVSNLIRWRPFQFSRADSVRRRGVPKGHYHLAQGCEARATLGWGGNKQP